MCTLFTASRYVENVDLEWLMHYQIPCLELEKFHSATLETKPSNLPRSTKNPSVDPRRGLFTTIVRKKGDLLCAFPGYWMNNDLCALQQNKEVDLYAFTPPSEQGWPQMPELVYATHPCQANFMNDGVIGEEVHKHTHTYTRTHTHTHTHTHTEVVIHTLPISGRRPQ